MPLTPYPSLATLPEVVSNGGKIPARSVDALSSRTVYASSIPGVVLDCDLATGAKIGGGVPTDNASRINAVLATATPSNPIHLIMDGASAIGSPILIPPTGHVTISGRGWHDGFFVLSGSNCNAIQNVPHTDLAVLRAWNPISFQSQAPGSDSNIRIENLKIDGNRGTFPNGNVSATNNTDGTVVNGVTSGAQGTANYAPDARGVFTSGGAWFNCIMLQSARNVHIENVWCYNPPANFIMLFHCQQVWVDKCRIETPHLDEQFQDGVHCNGGCSGIYITNCHLRTSDDAVAFNLGEGDSGDGDGFFVHNCYFDRCMTGGRVDVLGSNARNVVFSNIRGSVLTWGPQIGVEQVDWIHPEAHHSVSFHDIELSVGAGDPNAAMFLLSHPAGHVDIANCRMIEPTGAVPMVRVGSTNGARPVISSIRMSGCSIHRNRNGAAAAFGLAGTGGTVNHLAIEGFRVTEEAATAGSISDIPVLFDLGGLTVNHVSIDADVKGVATVLNVASTSTVGEVMVKGLAHRSNATTPTAHSIVSAAITVVPVSVGHYTATNVAGIATGSVTLSGPGLAGIGLADSLVSDGWPYLSAPHVSVPAIKLAGVVNLYATSPASTLSPGTATPGPATTSAAAATATDATGGTAPYSYQWFRSTTPGVLGSAVAGQTTRTLADSGLTAGTTYYYSLRYTDASTGSVVSNQIAETTPAGGLSDLFAGAAGSSLVGHVPESGATWSGSASSMYPGSDLRLTGDGFVYNNRVGSSLILTPTVLSGTNHVVRDQMRFQTQISGATSGISLWTTSAPTDSRLFWKDGSWVLNFGGSSFNSAFPFPGAGTVVDRRITVVDAATRSITCEISTDGGATWTTLFGGNKTAAADGNPFSPGLWYDLQNSPTTGVLVGNLRAS